MSRIIMLVPCYNEEHRLDDYIESIKKQTVDVDIIAIDDGSSDNTFNKLKDHNLLHVERNSRNLGLIKTINKLFKLAEAYQPDFLTWSGADDDLYPDSIERRLAYLVENRGDVVVTGLDFKTKTGEILYPDTIPRHEALPFTNFNNLYEELLPGNFIGPPILLNMKSVNYDDLLWDERTKHLGDWDQWLTLSKKYKFCFLHSSTGKSDWDGTNISAPNPALYWEKAMEFAYILNKHLIHQAEAVDSLLVLKTLLRSVERLGRYLLCTYMPERYKPKVPTH